MHLDRLSHATFEKFFRDFYGDENLSLPKVHIYSHRVSLIITKILHVKGITVGRHIFIHPQFTWRGDTDKRLYASKALIAHELTHTMQYSRQGFFGFLYSYINSYWKLLRKSEKWNFNARRQAYNDIPQEIEARRAARVFMSQSLETDFEGV